MSRAYKEGDAILVIQASHDDLVRLRKYLHTCSITNRMRDALFKKGHRSFLTPLVPDGFEQIEPILDLATRRPCGVCLKGVAEVNSRTCAECKITPPDPVNRRR